MAALTVSRLYDLLGAIEKIGLLCYDKIMIEEHGIVVQCKGDIAVIRAERTTACDGCSSKDACVSGKGADMLIDAFNPVGARPGQRVVFTVGSASVMKAGLLLYLAPVLSFILGVVLGQAAAGRIFPEQNADLVSGLFGAAFLVIAFLGIKLYSRFAEKDRAFRPHILRVE